MKLLFLEGGRRSRQIPSVTILHIPYRLGLRIFISRIIIQQLWVDRLVLSIRSHIYPLTLQNDPTFPFHICFTCCSLRVMNNLPSYHKVILFCRHILNFFYFPFNRHHLNSPLRDDFLIILFDVFYRIVFCSNNFPWHFFHVLLFTILHYFPFYRNFFYYLPVLILYHFSLVWDIVYSTIA